MERDAFDRWLAHQATAATAAVEPLARRGEELFLSTALSGPT
jgi:flavin-dependent dehydrogenase